MHLPVSFVKGFSTSFAGFLKSSAQGLHPRLELDRWGRSSLAAALLLPGGSVLAASSASKRSSPCAQACRSGRRAFAPRGVRATFLKERRSKLLSARAFKMCALWLSTAPFRRDPFQRAPGSWSELASLFAFLPWVHFPGESAGTSEGFGESRSQLSMH